MYNFQGFSRPAANGTVADMGFHHIMENSIVELPDERQ
jgi:hypothetical protein